MTSNFSLTDLKITRNGVTQSFLESLYPTILIGKCTVDSKDNKEDKTREEADMTLTPVFPKSSKVVPMCPKVS